jgi:heat shock protein HspQ
MKLMLGQQVKFLLRVFAFIVVILFSNPSFSLDLEEQLAASRREIKVAHHREIDLENHHKTLQRATLGAVVAINIKGVFLEDRQ